jgi:hypothetical protein
MARLMTAMGKEVAGVLLIGPPSRRRGFRLRGGRTDRRLLRHLDDAIAAEPGARLSPRRENRLLRFRERDNEIAMGVRAGDKHAMRIMRAATLNRMAFNAYERLMGRGERTYDGRVVLFMPGDDSADARREALDQWRPALLREPEIVDTPGQHGTVVFGEGARTVGAWLATEIARLRRRA